MNIPLHNVMATAVWLVENTTPFKQIADFKLHEVEIQE